MKYVTTYILLIFYLAEIFRPAIPVLDYILHYHYYAEVVCENKDKPELHCNGQCHLKKELKKTTEKSKNKKSVLVDTKLKEYTYYYRIGIIRFIHKKLSFNSVKIREIIADCQSGFLQELLKPPQC